MLEHVDEYHAIPFIERQVFSSLLARGELNRRILLVGLKWEQT